MNHLSKQQYGTYRLATTADGAKAALRVRLRIQADQLYRVGRLMEAAEVLMTLAPAVEPTALAWAQPSTC